MDISTALTIFDTLSQETRLRTLRILVTAGTQGLPAGVVSERLGIPHNTLSFHLTHLTNAGIISSRKEGRSVIYYPNFEVTRDLVGFIVKDCCHEEYASIRHNKRSDCCVIDLTHSVTES